MTDTNAERDRTTDEPRPETTEEEVDGREVYVARDASGVAAVSEAEEAADPRASTDTDTDTDTDTGDSGSDGDSTDGESTARSGSD